MSEFKLVPVTPTVEMIAALGFDGDSDLAIGHGAISVGLSDAYAAMLAAAPQPPAHELLASLERFESDGEDFVKLHDVHDVVAMIKQPPALGGEPEVLRWLVDVEGYKAVSCETSEHANDTLHHYIGRGRKAVLIELVDRASVVRLQTELDEVVRLGKYAVACGTEAEARWDKEREQLQARTAALEGLLRKVRETLQREYWDQYAGLDETREIIDAALAEGAKS